MIGSSATRPATMIAAFDVGSTNSRAWLLDTASAGPAHVRARAVVPVGVRDAAIAGSTAPVRDAVRRLITELSATGAPAAVVGAGMITSALGIREVPHVAAPVRIEDLARHVVTFTDPDLCQVPIWLVPGVRCDGPTILDTDVMRGEETLVAGLLASGLAGPGTGVLNAGSHWKWIQIDGDGRIASSRTSLGGEVVHAVATTTVLKAALPEGPLRVVDEGWLIRGAEAAQAEGLLRAMFAVRLLQLQDRTTPEERHAYLVGATIAADVQALISRGLLATGGGIVVTGPERMAAAWARILAWAGVAARPLTDDQVEASFLAGISALTPHAAGRHQRLVTGEGSQASSDALQ
jgi:2-dehydro-3-deoxygalactonokinase